MSWTLCHTLPTGFTGFPVHHCHTIDHMDSIKRTDLYAASKAKAAISAHLSAAIWHKSHHLAVFHAGILIIILCFITGTFALYICSLADTFSCFLSHNTGNDLAYRFAAYRTTVHWRLSFCNGSCKTVTARISASTTIIPRKGLPDRNFFFIYFHSKLLPCSPKENTNKKANKGNEYSCCYNRPNIHLTPSLNQSGKSKECNGHKTGCDQHDRKALE